MRPTRLAEQCCFPRHLLVVEIPPDSGEFPPIGGWHRLERWVAPIGKVGGTDWKGGWHRLERWVAPIGKVGGTDCDYSESVGHWSDYGAAADLRFACLLKKGGGFPRQHFKST